ncbi:hypothetical protein GPECTOR_43g873 [Gonium pectorale]|uniref:Uncharacterized protein n=1 Tax=Gonium pectorale TaxID=33097 RepID=A0A150G9B3_GONPE|nr:hypothetical protein GPECTOR_43g873 [Gonium pectorale]|eukprot:KXZ46437.1 hypothetical protein GPECTOR_43g873 [Gonium pectorale]
MASAGAGAGGTGASATRGVGALPRSATSLPRIPPPAIRVSPGGRGSGLMAVVHMAARFPVPADVVFKLLTHPDKSGAFRSILEVLERREVPPSAAPEGSSGAEGQSIRAYEETQVGEMSILWHHTTFRTRVLLEEDTTDPRVSVQSFRLLHGDTLERFEGRWVVEAAEPSTIRAHVLTESRLEAAAHRNEPRPSPVASALPEPATAAAVSPRPGGSSRGASEAGVDSRVGEDDWEDVGGAGPSSSTAPAPAPAPLPPPAAGDESLHGIDASVASIATTGGWSDAAGADLALLGDLAAVGGGGYSGTESEAGDRGEASQGRALEWCNVSLQQGLTPKGIPVLVRPAVAGMVRSATEKAVQRLHEDLSAMVLQVLRGASLDEAVAAVREEHHAQQPRGHQEHHHHHKEAAAGKQPGASGTAAAAAATGGAAGGSAEAANAVTAATASDIRGNEQAEEPAGPAGGAASAAPPPSHKAPTTHGSAGAAGATTAPTLVRNPRTGEVVHKWVA